MSMRLEQFMSPMVDLYYPSQFKEMSHYLDEEWISSSETSAQAPFPEYSHPFEENPTSTTLPFTTPETPADFVFAKPRNSAQYNQHVQDLIFPGMTTQGLGIDTQGLTPLLPSNLSSPISESMPAPDYGRRKSTPVPILPNPSGVRQMRELKRSRDESDTGDSPYKRRKPSTPYQRSVDLSDEEKLLLELKEDQNRPWKEIAQRFEETFKKQYNVPTLQMRIKRLRDRMRTWSEEDVQALQKAHEYWEKNKFEIIANKMIEFGALEKWPAKFCEKKWHELHQEVPTSSSTSLPSTSLPMTSEAQWLQDSGPVYDTPLQLASEISEPLQTPNLRTPGTRSPPRSRTP